MRRLSFAALVCVSLLGSASVVVAQENIALGCGMPEMPIVGPAKDRLANADKDLKDGRFGQAWRKALSVTEMEGATDRERADAHAIMGWIRMRAGAREDAVKELNLAKKLDAKSIDSLLALRADPKIDAEVKKAAEA